MQMLGARGEGGPRAAARDRRCSSQPHENYSEPPRSHVMDNEREAGFTQDEIPF